MRTYHVTSAIDVVSVTLTLDVAAYAAGDVIADAQAFRGARSVDGRAVLDSLTVIDKDDQGAAFTVYFMKGSGTFGAENGAPEISDPNASDILGFVDVATTDYKDLVGVKVACLRNLGLAMEAVTGTQDVYLAVVNGAGSPTYTVNGLTLVLGLRS